MRNDAFGAQVGQGQKRRPVVEIGQGGLGERRKAVGADVVRDAVVLTAQAIQKIAGNGLARRKAYAVDQTVKAGPLGRQVLK